MKRNILLIQILMLLPFGAALAYLVLPISDRYPVQADVSFSLLCLFVLIPFLLIVSGFVFTQHAGILRHLAALSPCCLAPLAILNAWVLVPTLPDACGGYGFFLHWLTKYPNFGLINIEVLLGLLCVLLSSFLPAVFSIYAITQGPRRLAVLAFVALELPYLIAVIINLDLDMLLAGFRVLNPTYFMGPILRLAGAVSMCTVTLVICLKRIEQSHGKAAQA